MIYNSLTCDPNTQSSSNTLFIVVVCRWFGFPSAFIFAAMKKKHIRSGGGHLRLL